ncbi:sigma-70 family RNA polymerase sigma factor [Sphingobium aquiterrae]|uniref:sigma-70 family RNA polymerase sigma factor n=1 Tax=Sphingobium aquiterrae TaxID=2038656 RepID=UPI003016D483
MKINARLRAAWLAEHILPHEQWIRRQLRPGGVLGYEVDDIVQEAYARIIMLDSIDHIDNPRAYFLQVARSLILQYSRRSRVVPIDLVADMGSLDSAANGPLPDQQVHGRQELQRLMQAIAALPPRCQEVYRLRKIEGLTQRQVAEKLMMSESNVEKHLGRGVEKMMGLFAYGERPAHTPAQDPNVNGGTQSSSARRR